MYEKLKMNQIDVFHFEETRPSFETFAKENGIRYWLGSDLAEMLGYEELDSIRKAINKAVAVCTSLNISVSENFAQIASEKNKNDFKLTRFACYLTVMNGDIRNEKIAKAQAYFVNIAETFQDSIQSTDNLERVLVRGEVSEREKSLNRTASAHKVENYAFFQNAGYRGLYNMSLNNLKARKGLVSGVLLDFMGKEELAANLFRITQTEAKIRNENIIGQNPLENAAESVGKAVRKTIIETGGNRPENLPLESNISEVKKNIKATEKGMVKLDKPKKKPISRT